MKYVIGVVGENGAGKAVFTTYFRAAAAPATVSRLRFSDVLIKTLSLWGLPFTRANAQNLAISMDKTFGEGSLTRAAEAMLKKQKGEFAIIEGIRWLSDVPMIRSFPNSFIVYITANPKVRYDRMKERGEKVDEKDKTYIQFLAEEKAATEVQIPQIGAKADFKIENNGSIEEFRAKVEEFYRIRFSSTKK